MSYCTGRCSRYNTLMAGKNTNAKENEMKTVRIIGNDATRYRLVDSKTNAVVGAAANRALCMLLAYRKQWTIVR
jgi:hypothetical protein